MPLREINRGKSMENKVNSKLLTIKQAAEYLNLKISRLRAAVFRKEISIVKIGALIRFDMDDLIEWIESRKIKSTY